MPESLALLEDKWACPPDGDEIDLLVWRSNLLGSDLRITNYAGGNTSAKVELPDPLTGEPVPVLVVKGSGGDLGSILRTGFAQLYLSKLEALKRLYRGAEREDEMAALYPVCTFDAPGAPASIDTPLHAFLPFRHVDHLHPDWAIALAAAANGQEKLTEFNHSFERKLVWIPWRRPGFELGLALEAALAGNPGCDGFVLANHGLFTWGDTAEECYRNSIRTIDQLGIFVHQHETAVPAFGGQREIIKRDAVRLIRELRDARKTKSIAHFDSSDEVMEFVNSEQASELAAKGTSCPDHFIRTRVWPLLVPGNETDIEGAVAGYRDRYCRYYDAHRKPDSPGLRSADPAVVLVPGTGMFTFGRNKKEATVTAEFYRNAIRVMRGATALGAGNPDNYVALAESEAFRIEYWWLEEAKLRRMPSEGVLATFVAWVAAAEDDDTLIRWLRRLGAEVSGKPIAETVLEYGGIDIVVNAPEDKLSEARPLTVIRGSSPNKMEIAAYAEALSGS